MLVDHDLLQAPNRSGLPSSIPRVHSSIFVETRVVGGMVSIRPLRVEKDLLSPRERAQLHAIDDSTSDGLGVDASSPVAKQKVKPLRRQLPKSDGGLQ